MATKSKFDLTKLKGKVKPDTKPEKETNHTPAVSKLPADKKDVTRFTIDIPTEKHKRMRSRAFQLEKESMKDYFLMLVDADLAAADAAAAKKK